MGLRKKPIPLKAPNSYKISEIEVEWKEDISTNLILGKLRIKINDSITAEQIEERVNTLYGTRYFKKIAYSIDGTGKLILKIKEAPRGFVKFAA